MDSPQNIVPSSALSEIELIKQLSTLDQRAIVRPNNPPYGIAGFLFDIVTEDAVELTSDITDHYVEDNTAIQDHIALAPEQITVRGIVAELVRRQPAENVRSRVDNPLPLLTTISPEFTPGAAERLAARAARTVDANRAALYSQSVYNFYQNRASTPPRQTRQSAAFLYFYSLWKSRQLFTVESPWGYWTNVAISSFRGVQGAETKYASDFTLTFKKIRVARDITVNLGQLAGRNAPQRGASQPTQNGTAGQQAATAQQKQSWFYRWVNPSP